MGNIGVKTVRLEEIPLEEFPLEEELRKFHFEAVKKFKNQIFS